MNKKLISLRNTGGLGLAALLMAGASSSMATTFDASTTVQNALTVTQVQAMNFGTLFATAALDATATNYSYLTLLPAGGFDDTAKFGATGKPLISLGGAQPARASVAVGSTAQFNVTLPNTPLTGLTTAGAAITATVTTYPQLRLGGTGGDPGVARFYLGNFTMGDATGGTISAPTGSVYPVVPSFGSTNVEFGIGAVITTDLEGSGSTRNTYQAGTYTATFDVTASY